MLPFGGGGREWKKMIYECRQLKIMLRKGSLKDFFLSRIEKVLIALSAVIFYDNTFYYNGRKDREEYIECDLENVINDGNVLRIN